MAVPIGKWFRVEFVARLGKEATGTYDLTVTLPGQPPHRPSRKRQPGRLRRRQQREPHGAIGQPI